MTQKGDHTWDLHIKYHRCPKCGFILESRKDYEYQLGKYFKELQCDRCKHEFRLYKESEPSVTPLFGEPQPVEVDWINRS